MLDNHISDGRFFTKWHHPLLVCHTSCSIFSHFWQSIWKVLFFFLSQYCHVCAVFPKMHRKHFILLRPCVFHFIFILFYSLCISVPEILGSHCGLVSNFVFSLWVFKQKRNLWTTNKAKTTIVPPPLFFSK